MLCFLIVYYDVLCEQEQSGAPVLPDMGSVQVKSVFVDNPPALGYIISSKGGAPCLGLLKGKMRN